MAWTPLPCKRCYHTVFNNAAPLPPPQPGPAAAHQGLLLPPQPLVIFHHLLLLLVQDLPHLGPLSLPQLLGLFSAAGADEVLLLGGSGGREEDTMSPVPRPEEGQSSDEPCAATDPASPLLFLL